jgi:hypothetical protein
MSIDDLREEMECNGYAHFDRDAFVNDATKVCYIPENAEMLDECYTYLDLRDEVEEWAKDNQDYLEEHETTKEAILNAMFENLEWTFPSTYLAELN